MYSGTSSRYQLLSQSATTHLQQHKILIVRGSFQLKKNQVMWCGTVLVLVNAGFVPGLPVWCRIVALSKMPSVSDEKDHVCLHMDWHLSGREYFRLKWGKNFFSWIYGSSHSSDHYLTFPVKQLLVSVAQKLKKFVKSMKLIVVKGSSGLLIFLRHYICSGKKEIKNILPKQPQITNTHWNNRLFVGCLENFV